MGNGELAGIGSEISGALSHFSPPLKGDHSMGVLNKMFGGANGIRESMQESYVKHRKLVESGQAQVADVSDAHFMGLYGALNTRYWARGIRRTEPQLMIELAPFCAMQDKNAALSMLSEYAVYQERPGEAQIGLLKIVINTSLRSCEEDHWLQAVATGVRQQADWSDLLEPETLKFLLTTIERSKKKVGFPGLGTRVENDKVVIGCPRCGQKLRVRSGTNLTATCPVCNTDIDL
jgi:hypothetical protein